MSAKYKSSGLLDVRTLGAVGGGSCRVWKSRSPCPWPVLRARPAARAAPSFTDFHQSSSGGASKQPGVCSTSGPVGGWWKQKTRTTSRLQLFHQSGSTFRQPASRMRVSPFLKRDLVGHLRLGFFGRWLRWVGRRRFQSKIGTGALCIGQQPPTSTGKQPV